MKDELNILLILVVLNLCVTMFLIARSFSVTIKKGSFPSARRIAGEWLFLIASIAVSVAFGIQQDDRPTGFKTLALIYFARSLIWAIFKLMPKKNQ